MSNLSDFKRELSALGKAVSGSDGTKKERAETGSRFADFLREKNVQIKAVEHIKARHIRDFAARQIERGKDPRTIQKELGHLRQILRQAGRGQLADLKDISNKNLGVGGASRDGKKTALHPDRVRDLVANLKTPGVRAVVWLAQNLGLRAEEGRQADRDTLKRWEKNLMDGKPLRVIRGTKGAVKRSVEPFDRARALAAVRGALKVAESNPKGVLIPAASLKQAETLYRNEMNRAGFVGEASGHALRYAFARAQFEGYRAEGLSEKEALTATSLDLGHGDGRGHYVKQVYLR